MFYQVNRTLQNLVNTLKIDALDSD